MPKLDITELDRELRGGKLRPIYIIYGAEYHLVRTALRSIKETIIGKDGDDFAVKQLSGKEVRAGDVITALKTVSMLGGRPLVIIRDGQSIPKSALEALTDYVENPVESATLVIVAEKMDGRTKFMQIGTKTGAVIEAKPLYMDKVPNWINMEVKRQGRQISQDSARFLADMVGNDMGQLTQAIERVILYVGEKKIIDVKDIEGAITETHQHDVFELTDAVGERRLPKAVALLHNIIGNGGVPVVVLGLLARHFRILSKAKDIAGRMPDGGAAKYLGVHPFFAKNYVAQSKNFSSGELKNAFRILHRSDRELKSSRVGNERILEKALFALVRGKNTVGK